MTKSPADYERLAAEHEEEAQRATSPDERYAHLDVAALLRDVAERTRATQRPTPPEP